MARFRRRRRPGQEEDQDPDEDDINYTIRRRSLLRPSNPATTGPPSPTRAASALAVRRVLQAGEAHATDGVGPAGQNALQFTLANTQLSKRLEIARVCWRWRAGRGGGGITCSEQEQTMRRDVCPDTPVVLPPVTRVTYELVDRTGALEQLFRVLSMHSQAALCPARPSGHGKSFLARKFGKLLDVPTHTVNMTTLRTAHDLWQAYSMNPYECEPTTWKRCVVVLDEIERLRRNPWSLLMPWESVSRCSFEASSRHIDVRNVHHASRAHPDELMSREEYVELMNLVRFRCLNTWGKIAVLSLILVLIGLLRPSAQRHFTRSPGDDISAPPPTLDTLIQRALLSYVPSEGARSLYRAVSNQLVDL
ncbi:hypothetical protein B0H10DRAFT_2162674 [Mycena sp. CBHHK59/15]|nr:hypothetical protein B0H10DRAFT_2162674 [Mycena sp. CBHHK59/15]